MQQEDLFPQEKLTQKQIEKALFERALAVAKGNLMTVDSAVRLVLRKAYYEFEVLNQGRWIYLFDKTKRKVRRAIRKQQNTRARA